MSKLSISDPTIRVKPGQRLIEFIVNLKEPIELPENVLKIYQSFGGDSSVQHTNHTQDVAKPEFSLAELELLGKLNRNEIGSDVTTELSKIIFAQDDEPNDCDEVVDLTQTGKSSSKSETKRLKLMQKEQQRSKLILHLNDLKWLNALLVEKRKLNDNNPEYLHVLLEDATLLLPKNEIQERNPELEARCVRLRQEQNARVYNAMTRNVDSSRRQIPDDTIAFQSKYPNISLAMITSNVISLVVKQINRHLIAVLQFLFSVAAGFAFGFIGVELIIGGLDFGFRLLLGIICALVIALAEIYFLAKQLNEEYDLATSDRVQLHQAPAVGQKAVVVTQNALANGGGKEHAE